MLNSSALNSRPTPQPTTGLRLPPVGLAPLLMATYCMVSGGPYGLEELIAKTGYTTSLLVLILLPLCWSLPTTLMVSELCAALPAEGGFYVWARRGLGRFWGLQQAWLSLAASIFDMALYPTLFVAYLAQLWPEAGKGVAPMLLGTAMIGLCVAWNLAGAGAVSRGAEWLGLLLLAPFAVLIVMAFRAPAVPLTHSPLASPDLLGGVLIAMWNYMGWDNASTFAGEVRHPQRAYPRAIPGALALTVLTYLLPVAAAWRAGAPLSLWTTGSWPEVGALVAGRGLKIALVVGGMISAFGMFNALVLSYSRLPYALAKDGYLPRPFLRTLPRNGAPWVAVVACGIAWSLSLGLSFARLVMLDLMLYGCSLMLEFVALIVLRRREPELARPFRVPGGMAGAILIAVPPAALIAMGLLRAGQERLGPVTAFQLGIMLIAVGPLLYAWGRRRARSTELAVEYEDAPPSQ